VVVESTRIFSWQVNDAYVVILVWAPRREVCRRSCHHCNHGYDRISI